MKKLVNLLNKRWRKKCVSKDFPEYHLSILEDINDRYNLKGKTVIDIGGSNIPEIVMKSFGVSKFVCLDPVSKWGYASKDNIVFGKHIYKYHDYQMANKRHYSYIIDEDIEKIGKQLCNTFDIAFSISTFEHVTSLEKTLEQIYLILKPDGILYSQYEPVFTSASGHHVWVNENINFNNLPDLDHAQILHTPKETDQLLQKKSQIDSATRKKIINQMYKSKIINRFFFSQHMEKITNSQFNHFDISYFYLQKTSKNTVKKLEKKYGKMRYDVRGIRCIAKK